MFVQEFGLFSTTFKRVDGQEVVAPNSLLASSKLVHNLRRSNSMYELSLRVMGKSLMCFTVRSETTTLMISYDTSLDIIERLKSRLQAYATENSREWSNVSLNIDKMDYQNAIYLTIAMEREYQTSIYIPLLHDENRSIKLARLGRALDSQDTIYAASEDRSRGT